MSNFNKIDPKRGYKLKVLKCTWDSCRRICTCNSVDARSKLGYDVGAAIAVQSVSVSERQKNNRCKCDVE